MVYFWKTAQIIFKGQRNEEYTSGLRILHGNGDACRQGKHRACQYRYFEASARAYNKPHQATRHAQNFDSEIDTFSSHFS